MAVSFVASSSQYVTVPYNSRMDTTSFSICAWVNPSSATQQRVLSRAASQSTTNQVYGLDVYQNTCRLVIGKAVTGGLLNLSTTYTVDALSGGSVPAGTLSHIVGTYDGSTMKIYVNGVLISTLARSASSIPLLAGNAALSIGADYTGSTASNFFDGQLEDVRLYTRALTDNEILTHYTTLGSCASSYGLILNIGMFEGSRATTIVQNGTLRDYGPFSSHATYPGTTNLAFRSCFSRLRRSV